MADNEIEVPLGVREDLPHWVEETRLGDARGALAQYRYGNLHIRRYADRYTVHVDHADPRRDPVGHLVHDAPDVLAGIIAGPILGYASYRLAQRLWGARDVWPAIPARLGPPCALCHCAARRSQKVAQKGKHRV